MSAKNRKPKVSRGFIVGVITVAVVAIGVGLVIKYMYPVSANSYSFADLFSTFTSSKCNQSEEVGDTRNKPSYYNEVGTTSSAKEGLSKSFDVIGAGINNHLFVLRPTLTIKNASSSTKNVFSKGDKIKLSLNVENVGSYMYAFNPQFYVHFVDTQTGAVLDNGIIGGNTYPQVLQVGSTSKWRGDNEYLIPSNVYGKLKVRLIHYIGGNTTKLCGPAIDAWELDLGSGRTSESPTPTVSATAGTSATVDSVTIEAKPGFNAYSLPSTTKVLDTATIKSEGMKVFAFNLRSQEDWNTTTDTERIIHRIGYYIYNPDTTTKIVEVQKSASQDELDPIYIHKGWNLLANPESVDRTLKEIEVDITDCPTGTTAGATCMGLHQEVRLSSLFIGDVNTQKAYPTIFVIDDPYATDANTAFTTLQITDQNRKTATIPANKLYWVYLWPN